MSDVPSLNQMLDRFRAWRTAAGLSYSALALNAGLSRSALMTMDDDDWSPGGDTIRALEASVPRNWQPGDPVPVKPAKAMSPKARVA